MKSYRILGLLLLVLLGEGCRDNFLDTRVDTLIKEDALLTSNGNLWGVATRMYTSVQSGFDIIDNNLLAAITDDAQQTSVSGNSYYFTRGIVSPDAHPLWNLYNNYYEGIRAANFFLDFAEKHGEEIILYGADTIRAQSDIDRNFQMLEWYKEEAYIAKAYYYGELIKMYGDVPVVNSTREEDDNPDNLERTSYDDVVDYIVELIDGHIDGLNPEWIGTVIESTNVTDQHGRFTPKVAMAIKARVLLYAASPLNNPSNDISKWGRAAKAADDLIHYMNYSIPSNRDYNAVFRGSGPSNNIDAMIWTFKSSSTNDFEKRNYPITTVGGNSGVTPSHNLVSSYELIGAEDPNNPYVNRDPRLNASIVVNGSLWNGRQIDETPGGQDDMSIRNTSRTGYYLKKFLTDGLNLERGEDAQHQWILYRYAEVLLNYAEAANEAYGPDVLPSGFEMTAREALMEVRNAASTDLPPVTTTSQDEFRDAVKHERRIELAFEGHRYWDLLRWEDAMDVLNQPIMGVKVADGEFGYEYDPIQVEDRKFSERNYHFPFSRGEIVKSDGKLIQNPGYGD